MTDGIKLEELEELEVFVGEAYQALGDILCDLPDGHPVEARAVALLDKLADPWAAIKAKA